MTTVFAAKKAPEGAEAVDKANFVEAIWIVAGLCPAPRKGLAGP